MWELSVGTSAGIIYLKTTARDITGLEFRVGHSCSSRKSPHNIKQNNEFDFQGKTFTAKEKDLIGVLQHLHFSKM